MRNEEIPLRQILRAPEQLQEMLEDLQRCDNDGKMGRWYLEAHGRNEVTYEGHVSYRR